MPEPKISKCRGCGADIYWVKMKSGSNMPVDAEKVTVKEQQPDKKVTLITLDGQTKCFARVGDSGYIPHWSTCPQASTFRKRSKK